MNRRLVLLLLMIWGGMSSLAQNIPVPLTQTKLYDYLDELVTDGVISVQTAVRPYTRNQVAKMLVDAQTADSLLNIRQKKELAFYLNEFALERDTMVNNYVQYTDYATYNLSLADPQFSYMTKDKKFKMRLRPILGANILASSKGAILQRWYGVDLQMDVAKHLSIWGSLRDNSWSGNWLNKHYYPADNERRNGARIHCECERHSECEEMALAFTMALRRCNPHYYLFQVYNTRRLIMVVTSRIRKEV